MLLGAAFLLVVDNVSRNLLAVEIPIGILTAFVGCALFHLFAYEAGENAVSIVVEQLHFAYGQRSVLRGVSFSAEDGCLLAVLGPQRRWKNHAVSVHPWPNEPL